MIGIILKNIKLYFFNKEWRKRNKHNLTNCNNIFPPIILKIGKGTYGGLNIYFCDNKPDQMHIGNYCSIAPNVTFLLGGEHNYDTLTTYPFAVLKFKSKITEAPSKGMIVIQDDVWIGIGATILSGVTISQGAIIGAGAVVTKDIPPYSIAVGNPAKVIKKRFSEDVIQFLSSIDLSKLQLDQKDEKQLYTQIKNLEDAKKIISKLQIEN